ncbi:hypothetical protein C4D60_Mb07t05950 [Musa balbisiana]|uniref:Uncharacterized protein n=1 Tax=Musa balbisiana TaxID=52838 RepID=A0A4S8JDA5_MUSBA|nr:hypothetical protein C4D60_Mb07t05950 [Musa balbisiana]
MGANCPGEIRTGRIDAIFLRSPFLDFLDLELICHRGSLLQVLLAVRGGWWNLQQPTSSYTGNVVIAPSEMGANCPELNIGKSSLFRGGLRGRSLLLPLRWPLVRLEGATLTNSQVAAVATAAAI